MAKNEEVAENGEVAENVADTKKESCYVGFPGPANLQACIFAMTSPPTEKVIHSILSF